VWNPEGLRPISADEMRALDRKAIEELRVPGLVLMENAGRSIAEEALKLLGDGSRAHIVAGAGNNGGDGFVVARHLANWGYEVSVTLAVDPAKLKGDALTNYNAALGMGLRIYAGPEDIAPEPLAERLANADLVVDALLGTGAKGAVRPPFDRIIAAINAADRPVLSVDLPSGLDPDTGRPMPEAVRADVTATCAVPKQGLVKEEARPFVGRLVTVYISLPGKIEPR